MDDSGSGYKVAMDFDRKHDMNIVAKLMKFKTTGSVADQPRGGCPRKWVDKVTTDVVVGASARSPQRKTRRLAVEGGVSG